MQALAQMLCGSGASGPSAIVADVVAHIDRVLNSRRGQAVSAPHYGAVLTHDEVRDVMALLPQSTSSLQQAVLQAVAAHEPRLSSWRLHKPSLCDGQTLTVYLEAQLGIELKGLVHIACILSPCGRTKVQLL